MKYLVCKERIFDPHKMKIIIFAANSFLKCYMNIDMLWDFSNNLHPIIVKRNLCQKSSFEISFKS